MRAATVIADKCLETLKQLRGITATYRMTNKPLPTKASHFVPTILSPLHNIVDSAENQAGPLSYCISPLCLPAHGRFYDQKD